MTTPSGAAKNLAEASVVHRLSVDEQRVWAGQVREVCRASPLVRPTTSRGQPMLVQVTSAGAIGWTGSRGGYTYERADSRGKSWPPIPAAWIALANEIAGEHEWDTAEKPTENG